MLQVAIAVCLAAPTLAAYPAYFGYNAPFPYQQFGPHYVPASTGPLIYPQHAPQVPVQQPTEIYSPADVYRGFAYQTTYNDGGVSQVVFVRGPDARALLEQSIRSFSFTSFPLLPLPATKSSSTQQNNITEAEPTSTVKAAKSDGPSTTAAPIAHVTVAPFTPVAPQLPIAHGTVAPFTPIAHGTVAPFTPIAHQSPIAHGTVAPFTPIAHQPGAFFYSVQVKPPEIDNQLTPGLPYFARSFINTPTDFFRRISIPPLFLAAEQAKPENNESSSNSSYGESLLDRSGLLSNSEGETTTSSKDISSPLPTAPSSSNDDTTSPETDVQTDSPADNGSDGTQENSDSNDDSSASNTESTVPSESSQSDTSAEDRSSGFDVTDETASSVDEGTTISSNESDSNSSSPATEDRSEDAGSSDHTEPSNESPSTDEPSDSFDSTEVPTTVATN